MPQKKKKKKDGRVEGKLGKKKPILQRQAL
uniref:Uncharacterized protein n=1 Tax=Human herpesvirus 2 TaxID=10310 RepID=A0A481T4C0_HHV2|nr:hypothetical protein [Human alphaherpesvirus 2]